jgi:hypothetical protein
MHLRMRGRYPGMYFILFFLQSYPPPPPPPSPGWGYRYDLSTLGILSWVIAASSNQASQHSSNDTLVTLSWIFMATSWHFHGDLVTLSWQPRDTFMPLSCHSYGTLMKWNPHGTIMAPSWHCHEMTPSWNPHDILMTLSCHSYDTLCHTLATLYIDSL